MFFISGLSQFSAEDWLHIEFEYDKDKYHLNDVVIGKIYFLLVRIKIKLMELQFYVENHSILTKRTQKAPIQRECKTCRANGVIPTDNHRTGRKCPFYKQSMCF